MSNGANGLQLSVSVSGGSSQTVYADISPSSPLCSTSGPTETCTITVPTLGANEQFVALETDTTPTGETASGYGTGFGSGTSILGAVNQTMNLGSELGSPIQISLELGEVVGLFIDCTPYWGPGPTAVPSVYSAGYGDDYTGFNNSTGSTGPFSGSRIVVTSGTSVTGSIAPIFLDWDCDWAYDATPAPFYDVNASPQPVSVTSNSSAVLVAPIANNATTPPLSAYAQTASISNDGYASQQGPVYFIAVNSTGSLSATSPASITINNNLTATNPFTNANQAATMTYSVVAIAANAYSLNVTHSTNSSTVVGTDYGAANGMDAESAWGANDENCNTSGSTTLASVTPSGPISTLHWTQTFTINAGPTLGTCTVYLYDRQAGTVTQPITVNVQ